MIRASFWIFILLFFQLHIPDDAKELKFERYTTDDGLYNNFCIFVMPDSDGFLWLGTAEGLHRFDGYNFVVYTNDNFDPRTISHSLIFSLLEDADRKLWVGTWGGGINIYNKEKNEFEHLRHSDKDPTSLRSDNIMAMLEDNKFIWVGSHGGGLERIDRRDYKITRFKLPDNTGAEILRVNTLCLDRTQILWVGTNNGLFKFDKNRKNYKYYSSAAVNSGLKTNDIEALYEDHEGILWVGTRMGLFRYDSEKDTFIDLNIKLDSGKIYGDLRIFCMFEDSQSRFWMGSDRGLYNFDKKSGKFIELGNGTDNLKILSSANIMKIIEDRNNILWVASNRGLFKMDLIKSNFKSYSIEDILSAAGKAGHISSVYIDNGNDLFVGTVNYGILKYRKILDRYVYNPENYWDKSSLKGKWISEILRDRSGDLWVGTRLSGISRLKKGDTNFHNFFDDESVNHALRIKGVLSIYEGRDGNIWIGSDGDGLIRVNNDLSKVTQFVHSEKDASSIGNNFIICFLEDSKNNFWVGTYGAGLELMDLKTGKFSHYRNISSNRNSLSGNIILSIKEDKNGTLWIGTYGSGLNKFDPVSGTFTHFRKKDGLPSNTIYGIVIDKYGYFWMNTENGISMMDPENNVFINYFEEDGLQGDEFGGAFFHNTKTDEIVMGGLNGFTVFKPEEIRYHKRKPVIRITYFEKFGGSRVAYRNIKIKSDFKLSYRDSFSLGFSLMDFSQPRECIYKYILHGRDNDWSNIGNTNSIFFDSLSPGKYMLRIKGGNKNGIWSDPVTLKLIVYPPFWKTWWFLLIISFLISSLVFMLYRIKLKIAIRKMEYKSRVEYFCKKSGLSERECEVLGLLIEGKNNKEIEDLLFISQNTVRNHVYNIYQKLKINSRVQLLKMFESSR